MSCQTALCALGRPSIVHNPSNTWIEPLAFEQKLPLLEDTLFAHPVFSCAACPPPQQQKWILKG